MKKILISLIAILVAVGLVGGGAFAYFNDTETSTGNTFTAGTIDLAMNDQNPWADSWEFTDIRPCQDLDPITAKFENVGNNEGILTFTFDYTENDKWAVEPSAEDFEFTSLGNGAMELSADQFAAILYVESVTQQYFCLAYPDGGGIHNDLPNWMAMDANGDEKVSLYELKNAGSIPWASEAGDTLPAGEASQFVVTFHLGDKLNDWSNVNSSIVTGMDNRPQADGIDMTITATLEQVR